MSITVIVSAQVADVDDCKAMFDDDADKRENVNIHATPYKELDEPNHVHVIATAPSKKAFVAFFSNPELQERLRESIVEGGGPPEVTFLEEV